MRKDIDIAPATLADIPILCELLATLFSQEVEFQPNQAAQRHALTEIISNQALGRIFVARLDADVVGMISLLFTVSTALGGQVVLLEDMVVKPGFRNRGIGSSLMEHAIDFARAHDCKRITLLTDSINQNAQRFYQKHGFDFSGMVAMRLMLDS